MLLYSSLPTIHAGHTAKWSTVPAHVSSCTAPSRFVAVASGPAEPAAERLVASRVPSVGRRRVECGASPSPSTVQTATLPTLQPLDDDYERKHTFGDFANWIVPGSVMVGRYPYVEPSRCNSHEKGEAQLEKIIEQGINTFVSLQAEVPAQQDMTLAGKDGFLPYKATAELIKSAHSPPPSMEVMMNLRNPTLDKFLPAKKRPTNESHTPSYQLNFDRFPIVDLSIPQDKDLLPFIQGLVDRVNKGEKLYIHCWGGRGRAGTVAACFLGYAYGLSVDEALQRVQRAFNTRQDTKESSPETPEQYEFVRKFFKNVLNK